MNRIVRISLSGGLIDLPTANPRQALDNATDRRSEYWTIGPDGIVRNTLYHEADGFADIPCNRPVYRTKEDAEEAALSKPDAEGWIPWGGGECPVSEGTPLIIRYRCGNEYWGAVADKPDADRTHGARGWRHDGGNGDIIAYRVCKPEAE